MLPSAEQASACHSEFVEASVKAQVWAYAASLAVITEHATIRPRTSCFDGKWRCQSSEGLGPDGLAALLPVFMGLGQRKLNIPAGSTFLPPRAVGKASLSAQRRRRGSSRSRRWDHRQFAANAQAAVRNEHCVGPA